MDPPSQSLEHTCMVVHADKPFRQTPPLNQLMYEKRRIRPE